MHRAKSIHKADGTQKWLASGQMQVRKQIDKRNKKR